MEKIVINQYILCDSFESAKKISKSFEGFKFKFYSLGNNSYVYAKRFIRKNSKSKYRPYVVIVRYTIEYDGEFSEYGFLDKKTQNKYPELIQKLSVEDKYKKRETIFKYRYKKDCLCEDIYYYENFEEFFNDKLKSCMNRIYLACVIAFANEISLDNFVIRYIEKGQYYERGYISKECYDIIRPSEYWEKLDTQPILVSTVWEWMGKNHKYQKDRSNSQARPLTAITYALNRSEFEKTFYSVIGLESVYTKNEKRVKKQLKETITKVFPTVSEDDIDLFYSKRSDFAHGDIVFPDYYESLKSTHCGSDYLNMAQKSTALLIITLRELVKNDAIKILLDSDNKIVFEKHQRGY